MLHVTHFHSLCFDVLQYKVNNRKPSTGGAGSTTDGTTTPNKTVVGTTSTTGTTTTTSSAPSPASVSTGYSLPPYVNPNRQRQQTGNNVNSLPTTTSTGTAALSSIHASLPTAVQGLLGEKVRAYVSQIVEGHPISSRLTSQATKIVVEEVYENCIETAEIAFSALILNMMSVNTATSSSSGGNSNVNNGKSIYV